MHKSNKGACKFMALSVRVRVLEVEVDGGGKGWRECLCKIVQVRSPLERPFPGWFSLTPPQSLTCASKIPWRLGKLVPYGALKDRLENTAFITKIMTTGEKFHKKCNAASRSGPWVNKWSPTWVYMYVATGRQRGSRIDRTPVTHWKFEWWMVEETSERPLSHEAWTEQDRIPAEASALTFSEH